MRVSAWKSGKFGSRKGGTWGVRIGRKDAKRYFDKRWKTVILDLDGFLHSVRVSGTFWTTCPELRNAAIGNWLTRHGLTPWPRRKPPKLELLPLASNRFKLSP